MHGASGTLETKGMLFEKYRPKSFADVVGQDAAVRTLERLGESGFGGKAFWITGRDTAT